MKFNEQDVVDVIQERYNNWAGICDNRKNHGKNCKKISFGELATKIAAKWKEADAGTKALMKKYSKKERERYFNFKRDAEVALNSPVALNSDRISNQICDTPSQTSSDDDHHIVVSPVAFQSSLCTGRVSLGLNSLRSTNKCEMHSKNGSMTNCDEDDWNSDFKATNREVNMVEKEQMVQYSENVSNTNGFVVNDTISSLHKDSNLVSEIVIKPYSRNKFWQTYVRRSLVYKETQFKYLLHLRRLRMMYWQLQILNPMHQYNGFAPSKLSGDSDYKFPFDDDCDDDIETADFIFDDPVESIYSNSNNVATNTEAVTNEMDLNYSESFSIQDNTFTQMKSFGNVSMSSFDDMNENIFNHDNDDDDFSVM